MCPSPSKVSQPGSLHLPCGTTNASKTMCQRQSSMEPEVSDSLFRAPHTNGKLLTAAALHSFSPYHSCHVYIPHVLTMEAEQLEHINIFSLQPVIQFASTGFLPTLEGCYSMLTDCSSNVYVCISLFLSYTLRNL